MTYTSTYAAPSNNIFFKLMLISMLIILSFFASGCALPKITGDSPEMPPKYWLQDAQGTNVTDKPDIKSNLEMPSLYDSKKEFSFSDSVYLAIQQSPLLVNSAIEIDTSKLKVIDAVWQYIPEPRMSIGVFPNLTMKNLDSKEKPHNYGETDISVSFYANLNNPVASYYNHKVQDISVDIAIASHRQVISEIIKKIATTYLKIEAQKEIEQVNKKIINIRKKTTTYWNKLESLEGQQGTNLKIAKQSELEAALRYKESLMVTNILKTDLKVITGVDTKNPLKIDASSSKDIVSSFNGYKLDWENRWDSSERNYILKKQSELYEYNIMISWAQYIPDIRFSINNDPPAGQYTPPDGQEDLFAQVYFDFPIIDWGRRYRNVQSARAAKALAFNKQLREQTNFSTKWLQLEQRFALEKNSVEIKKIALNIEELKNQEIKILFKNGSIALPKLMQSEHTLMLAHISYINKKLDLNLIKLDWMLHSNSLQEPFIGRAQKETEI